MCCATPRENGFFGAYNAHTHYANLDALIRREDFEVKSETMLSPAQLASTIQISQLEKENLWYQVLRKPDCQRETANWEPEKIADLVERFLEGDLIPIRMISERARPGYRVASCPYSPCG